MIELIRVIGPAPSEMSIEELTEKLRIERLRVTNALEEYRPKEKKTAPKTKKKRAKQVDEYQLLLKELGMTREEFIQAGKRIGTEE